MNRLFRYFTTISAMIAMAGLTQAASLTWDADTGTSGAQDGSGTWLTSQWWDGASDLAWPGSGNSAIFGAGSGAAGTITAGSLTCSNMTFNAPGSGTYTVNGGTITLDTNSTFNASGASATINAKLAGSTLQISGSSGYAITLGGSNTFTGALTVSSGATLKVSTNNALGTVAGGTTVNSGGVLDINGINYGAAEPLTINGTGISSGGALINSSVTAASFSGAVTLGTAGTSIGGAGDLTLTAALVSNAVSLVKSGNGTLALNTASTRTGATTINAGMISCTGALGIGSNSGTDTSIGAITLSGGTLKLAIDAGSNFAWGGGLVFPAGNTGTFVLDRQNTGGTVQYTTYLTIQSGATANFTKGANVTNTATFRCQGSNGTALNSSTLNIGPGVNVYAPNAIGYVIASNAVINLRSSGTGGGIYQLDQNTGVTANPHTWNVDSNAVLITRGQLGVSGVQNCTVNIGQLGAGGELQGSKFASYSGSTSYKIHLFNSGNIVPPAAGGTVYGEVWAEATGGTLMRDAGGTTRAGNTATLGPLHIGNVTLNTATRNGTWSSKPGVTFGATSLTGNPTLNATNVNITLGALNDDGVQRTLTFTGNATNTLNGSTGPSMAGTKYIIDSGATLSVNNAGALGATPVVWNGGTFKVSSTVAVESLKDGSGNDGALDVVCSSAAGRLNLGTNGANNTISGVISGTGTLRQLGTGKLTLSGTGANTVGYIYVHNGELDLDKTGAAAISGYLYVDGLQPNGVTPTTAPVAKPLQDNQFDSTTAYLFVQNGGSFNLNGKAVSVLGLGSLGGDATISGGTITIGNDGGAGAGIYGAAFNDNSGSGSWFGTCTVSANIAGTGGVTKDQTYPSPTRNSSLLVLSGDNSFTGPVTILSGTLSVPTINAEGVNGPLGAGLSTVSLGGGNTIGNLQYTGGSTSSSRSFQLYPGAGFDVADSGTTLTLTGTITDDPGTGSTVASLYKWGAGTLVLSGAKAYTGDTYAEEGTLKIDHANSLGTGSRGIYLDGGALDLNGVTVLTKNVIGAGTLRNSAAGSPVNVDGLSLNIVAAGNNYSSSPTVNFSFGGASAVANLGPTTASFTLSGGSDYAVGDVVAILGAGITAYLVIDSVSDMAITGWHLETASSFGNFSDAAMVGATLEDIQKESGVYNSDAYFTYQDGHLTINGVTLTSLGIGGYYSSGLPTVTLTGGGPAGGDGNGAVTAGGPIMLIGNSATLTADATGDMTVFSTITGVNSNSALTKVGTGALFLSATNTYAGPTHVQAGSLFVDGALSPDSAVTNDTGSTLGGTGSVGNVSCAGTIAPGHSVGSLTVSNLVLTGTYRAELSSGGGDQIIARGAVNLAGATLSPTNLNAVAGSFVIINKTSPGAVSGAFTGWPEGAINPANGIYYAITYSGGDGNDTVLTVTNATSTPIQSWQNHYGVAADESDSDGDGMNNYNEFLVGFNPTNSAAYLHILSETPSGNDIILNYLGANGDTNYAGGPAIRTNLVEYTDGNGNGGYTNNFPFVLATNVLSNGRGLGASVTVTNFGAVSSPARYYRVRVLLP